MKFLKVKFSLDLNRINAAGKAPIRVRSRHNTKKAIVRATGLFCDPKTFNDGSPKDTILRNQLRAYASKIEAIYEALPPGSTLADVWSAMNPAEGVYARPTSVKIVDWIEHYKSNSPYGSGYARGAEIIRVHLCGISRKSKKDQIKAFNPDLRFDQLNQSTVDALCRHIVAQGRGTGAAAKLVKFLRLVAKMAANNKVEVGATDFKLPKNYGKRKTPQIRLEFRELMKIHHLALKGTEAEVRDMFLLTAYTGLRHSDVTALTPANCFGEFLHFRQKKTVDEAAVTLHRFSKPIIKKYAAGKQTDEKLFPELTQQAYNRMIKEITKKAGIDEPTAMISVSVNAAGQLVETVKQVPKYKMMRSHTGRRTFARILALLRVDESVIAEEMGHNGGGITRHYIGNSDHESRIKSVQKAWNKADVKTLKTA